MLIIPACYHLLTRCRGFDTSSHRLYTYRPSGLFKSYFLAAISPNRERNGYGAGKVKNYSGTYIRYLLQYFTMKLLPLNFNYVCQHNFLTQGNWQMSGRLGVWESSFILSFRNSKMCPVSVIRYSIIVPVHGCRIQICYNYLRLFK